MQLPVSIREFPSTIQSRQQLGIASLLAAGVLVGIAIATSGALSRAINGVSGVVWIAAAVLLLTSLRSDSRFWRRLLVVVAIGVVLVVLVRPSDLLLAVAGFGIAGALIANLFPNRPFGWAALLPALWLPLHLTYAVGRSVYRSMRDLPATLRADPPPTAALVPLAMIVAAMAGALIVIRYREMVRSRSRS